MKQLMISLDKQIADSNSRVAHRMISYGTEHDLYILIPDFEAKKIFELSSRVRVETTGGSKLQQFYRLITRGQDIINRYGLNFITTQDPFFTGLVGLALRTRRRSQFRTKKEKRQVKLEVQIHGDFYGSDFYKRRAGIKAKVQYYIGKWIVLRYADKIRVVSRRIKNNLVEMGLAKSKVRVRRIPTFLNYAESVGGMSTLKERNSFDKVFFVF